MKSATVEQELSTPLIEASADQEQPDENAELTDLERRLPKFLESFTCPNCGTGGLGKKSPSFAMPAVMIVFLCACDLSLVFLFDPTNQRIVWKGNGVFIHRGKLWLLDYNPLKNETCFWLNEVAATVHRLPSFVSPSRFKDLLCFL
jgi:hypothetical protein